MAGGDVTIHVEVDRTVVEERTLFVPADLPRAKRPPRAVVWRPGAEQETRTVVRLVPTRSGTDRARAGLALYEQLRGTTQDHIACDVRPATTWDLIRCDPEAWADAALAVLATFLAAVAAGIGVHAVLTRPLDDLTLPQEPSHVGWVVGLLVLAAGLSLAYRSARRHLRDLGP